MEHLNSEQIMGNFPRRNLFAIQAVVFVLVAVVTYLVYSQLAVVSYAEGEKPHGYFSVVATTQDPATQSVKYHLVDWWKLEEFRREQPQTTFLLPDMAGEFDKRVGEISGPSEFGWRARFKVLESAGGHQTIEVDWDINDDYISLSKYSTDGTSIRYISSYIRTPGPIIYGLILGLLASLIAGWLIKLLRRR